MTTGGKSQRKKLQRQLEFYLSESNLRQDKFLQQAMDKQGFVSVRVFLSFNKLKILKATERMILDAAEKSLTIQADWSRFCIAPKIMPAAGQDDNANARTIYIDSFGAMDDHDSLRQVFSQFGKVNLVSLPRFQQNKKLKGFGFIEFSDQQATDAAVNSSDTNLKGIRVMSKTRWLEMKEQLKRQLYHNDAAAVGSSKNGNTPDDGIKSCDLGSIATARIGIKKPWTSATKDHIHLDDDDVNDEANGGKETTKKRKV
ncbi:unnamed protein product [Peronospora belbahrii]|uniref:Uncharacterized protein n=1 Tax=Peronospora belbahrii TaxID=622444 RepID=A0ABN8D0X7_9STRA|nr:unnamed protein product [Peronospora belbahrii]